MKFNNSKTATFFALFLSAFIFSYVPIISIPFDWIETFFHEISHGLAAIFTGGSISKIELRIDGSGVCYTIGGSNFIISFAGYFGAVIWGMLVYEISDELHPKLANYISIFLAAIIVISLLMWGSGAVTYLVSVAMVMIFLMIVKVKNHTYSKLLLKFIGIYTLLGAIKSPLYLIDGRDKGDGYSLSEITGLPEIIWVSIWFATGIFGIYYLWKNSK